MRRGIKRKTWAFTLHGKLCIEKHLWGFLGGPVVKNLPCKARDTGSVPGLGRYRGATEPICHNKWTCALEPVSCNWRSLRAREPVLLNEKPAQEALVAQLESSPHSGQLEKAHTQWPRPTTAKNYTESKKKPKKQSFHHRLLEFKATNSRDTWSNGQVWPWSTKWSRVMAKRVLSREHIGHSKSPFPTTQEMMILHNGHHQVVDAWWYKDWLYSL